MQWNAAIFVNYSLPIPGREADAMKLFTDGMTLWGKLAAEDLCSEPEVFHHRDGGGFMFIRTESVESAERILQRDDVRRVIDIGLFTVQDFHVELMITGELLMDNMSFYGSVGSELAYM